jgi:hypothetical protein
MKNYMIFTALSALVLVPSLFANTATGTTATGTTATGTTATGTTATGTTATGTTATGTTATGTHCMTGSGFEANQAALMLAQKAFSTEVARLVAEKQVAYQATLSLTGTVRFDAMKAANLKFRTGFQVAIKTFNSIKQNHKLHRFEIKDCKKIEKDEHRDEKKEHKQEIKTEIKSLKEKIKEIQKSRVSFSTHR